MGETTKLNWWRPNFWTINRIIHILTSFDHAAMPFHAEKRKDSDGTASVTADPWQQKNLQSLRIATL